MQSHLNVDFLPVLKDGKKVYAGFWKRFFSATGDILVWLPVAFFFHYFQSINLSFAIAGTVEHAFFFSIYSIYFNLKYGGSLGKLDVYLFITNRVPSFKMKYSKMADHKYLGNTCPRCGLLSGEFFLHAEPGCPFFPEDEEDAKSLYTRLYSAYNPPMPQARIPFKIPKRTAPVD